MSEPKEVPAAEIIAETVAYLEEEYSFLTFESIRTETAPIFFRTADGTYREATFLPVQARKKAEQAASERGLEAIAGPDPGKVTARIVNEVITAIKQHSMVPMDVVDSSPERIKVKNGVLVLRSEKGPRLEETPVPSTEELVDLAQELRVSGERWPPSKKVFLTGLPVEYIPGEDCPGFKKFLSEVLPDERDRMTVQEIFGSFLYRGPVDRAFFFFGEGANGKSTLIRVMKAFLGEENIATRSLQELTTNRFAKADLYGKLANLYYDMPSTALLSTGEFKALVSGDPMAAERKFRDSFPFENYAKLVFSGNAIPQTRDETDAFFRRWVIVSFPFQFVPEEAFAEMKSRGEDMENVRVADPTVGERLSSERELSGILNWALEGLERLFEHGFHFSSELTIEETHERYLMLSNTVHAFVSDRCEITGMEEDYVEKDRLYQSYAAYCRERNLSPSSYPWFFRKLLQESTGISQSKPRGEDSRTRVITGLRLREPEL